MLRALWGEPRAPGSAPPGRWDAALVAGFAATAIAETVTRDVIVWRELSLACVVALLAALPWRRQHPLAILVGLYSVATGVQIAGLVAGVKWEGLYTGAALLILPYALFRWGSGRERILGALFMLGSLGAGTLIDMKTGGELIAATVVLMLPCAIGAAARHQSTIRRQEKEQVRLREREQLARELHDSVAHHVSAIVIQAQAGRTVAKTRPELAVQVLEVIEEAASRTLADMRSIVGALRDDQAPDMAPLPGVADIERLARDAGAHLRLAGELTDLRPAVGAALYRLAQESITNATRHARNATRVDVELVGEPGRVRLTVRDDGEGPVKAGAGFGLTGMKERVKLLGGTFHAGPGDGGWIVQATLPTEGPPP